MTGVADTLAPNSERLQRDLDALAGVTDSEFDGWTRQVFSPAYRAERPMIVAMMAEAGLNPHIDAAGNVVGRLPGRNSQLPPLMTGSHTDTVAGGGRFDGIVGVIGAIEAVRALREAGITLERDLVVVDFLGEEANPFGISCMGSRAIAGTLTAEHLDRDNGEGVRLGDAMTAFGADPSAALSLGWAPGSLHGYLELHIEQGPMLAQQGKQVGVVTAIAGIERVLATFTGSADHAGTTPMGDRHDALLAAAEGILTVERVGCGAPVHGVTTTGRIESSPGAMNVVPDHASIWAEIRSIDPTWLHGARRQIMDDIASSAAERGVHTMFDWLNDQDPVPTHPLVQDHIAKTSAALGYSTAMVPSGAGHDAAHLAALGPMGMIFIPSEGGKSHCPQEFTATEDISVGTRLLAATLVEMDRA